MMQAFIYSLKVWLTSVVLGSIINSLPITNSNAGIQGILLELLGTNLFLMCASALLSVCCWLMLYLFTFMFTKQSYPVTKAKIILSFLALLLAMAPVWWLMGNSLTNLKPISLSLMAYPASIIIGIWFYKLELVDKVKVDTL